MSERSERSYFHVGMIVPALEPALEELSGLLGLTWRDTIDGEVPLFLTDGGEQLIRLRFAYSQEAPHLEVIEGVPGTPWAYSETGSNLHHLGFWVDDLSAESERMSSACPMEVCDRGTEGERPVNFTYHQHPGGVRIELVNAAVKPFMFGQ